MTLPGRPLSFDVVRRPVGPFSRRARARLALSVAARRLSDLARQLVPTYADALADRGAFLREAQELVRQAEALRDCAVILERERGMSGDEIAAALGAGDPGTTAAHELEEAWHGSLRLPWRSPGNGEELVRQVPEGADEPEAWAPRLDEWVLHHRELVEPDPGRAPVTCGLEVADMRDELEDLLAGLASPSYEAAMPAERCMWLERKVLVLQVLSTREQSYRDTLVAPLEMARRELREARRRVASDQSDG